MGQVLHWKGKNISEKLNVDIICLQEIHIKIHDKKYLINKRTRGGFISAGLKKTNWVVLWN